MCTVLIIVPCVTETTDTLIGCGLLFIGFVPYKLWRNRSHVPKFLISFANWIQRGVGKNLVLSVIENGLDCYF